MESLFIRACRGSPVDRVPIWIMRQAGRYLPEYMKVKQQHDFATMRRTPELATEVTLQPIRRFGLDAAILFSDIMTPLESMGVEIGFTPGPKIGRPVRTARDVANLRVPDEGEITPFVAEAVKVLELGGGQRHVFNLGHGILPDVPVDSVYALVDTVRNYQLPTH